MSEVNVESICSSLQPLISEIFKEKIGICDGVIELYDVNSGKPSWETTKNLKIDDRIKLKIPFAGEYLSWEVVFNCCYPQYPPDFDLNDESFLSAVSIDTMEENVPSLLNWDFNDNKALFNVISELRVLYMKYQVEHMNQHNNNCAFEYASLLNKAAINPENIEVLVSGNTVHFLIHLDINFSHFDLPKEEHYYKIALATSFTPHTTTSHLIMSPDFEELLESNIHLPLFVKDTDPFGDYILNVINRIEEEIINAFIARDNKRKIFLFQLLDEFGQNSVINYDIMKHTYANFLLSHVGFTYILRVEIPKDFPRQSPIYKLQSVYNLDKGGNPFTHTITGVPFNSSWAVLSMIDKLCQYLETSNEIVKFHDNTMKLFKLTEKRKSKSKSE